MTITESLTLYLPITQKARQIAEKFAQQQLFPEKATQIKLNTLAILVVNDYLQMMGIETDINAGDSWQTAIRLCVNTADLEVVGLGKLECRAIKPSETNCRLPEEVLGDRVGYIIVEIDEEQREAGILGFLPNVNSISIPIANLQPIDELCTYLESLQPSLTKTLNTTINNLSQWFNHQFEEGWQILEEILNSNQLQAIPSFRMSQEFNNNIIKQAKLLDLGINLETCQVALVVELKPQNHSETAILLQIYPTGEQSFLPPNLSLEIKEETGATLAKVTSRSQDNLIQYQLIVESGENFIIEVTLGTAKIIERFTI